MSILTCKGQLEIALNSLDKARSKIKRLDAGNVSLDAKVRKISGRLVAKSKQLQRRDFKIKTMNKTIINLTAALDKKWY